MAIDAGRIAKDGIEGEAATRTARPPRGGWPCRGLPHLPSSLLAVTSTLMRTAA
jgi:hypothetical protein